MRTPLESLLESLSGDGTAETIGTVDDIGHHALLLDVSADELRKLARDVGLDPDELQEALSDHAEYASDRPCDVACPRRIVESAECVCSRRDGLAHYVIRTDYQGFLHVEGFATIEEARAAWSAVEALERTHHDEQERELSRQWEEQNPARWIVRQVAFSGCSDPQESFETEEEARAALQQRLDALRADGFDVTPQTPAPAPKNPSPPYVKELARFEAVEPDDAVMVPDSAGYYLLVGPDDDARESARERAVENGRGY